jgi:hypothetical protein
LRPFGPEPFGPELKAEGLKAEGLSTGYRTLVNGLDKSSPYITQNY